MLLPGPAAACTLDRLSGCHDPSLTASRLFQTKVHLRNLGGAGARRGVQVGEVP